MEGETWALQRKLFHSVLFAATPTADSEVIVGVGNTGYMHLWRMQDIYFDKLFSGQAK